MLAQKKQTFLAAVVLDMSKDPANSIGLGFAPPYGLFAGEVVKFEPLTIGMQVNRDVVHPSAFG